MTTLNNSIILQEKKLFNINILLVCLIWFVLTLCTFGLVWVYVLFGYIFFLFTHSAFISYIKGNAVLIGPEQFPDINARIQKACVKLGMATPESYMIDGHGVLNAFATKFLKHQYIVLNSDVISGLEDQPGSVDFYIGHELGHLHRKHLKWWPVFLPLYMFPLLMPAYRRACEKSCDQYGKFCCENIEDAVRGITMLATGPHKWKTVSASKFVDQVKETSGFWMSFHEITGSYPWLSKRVALVQDENALVKFPKRSTRAWILGLFCPGFVSGALLPIVIIYMAFIFGLLTASFIPMLNKLKKSKETSTYSQPATEVEAVANTSETEWTHPISKKVLTVPQGFKVVDNENTRVHATFVKDPAYHLEELSVEVFLEKPGLKYYIDQLYQVSLERLAIKTKISKPKMRTVKGQSVAEFDYKIADGPMTINVVVRAWTPDNIHYFNVLSSMRASKEGTAEDSERLFTYLIENSF